MEFATRKLADGTLAQVVVIEAAAGITAPAPATEATQQAVKAAIDAVKAATDAVKSATDAGTTSTDATTAAVSAANTAIVAAIVASGAGKATTADITALVATITATTLDEKNAIVAALAPLAGIQANTAATVNALATVNVNLAALLSATNTNDAAMLAAITATRDNVANAHSDAAAQLAEEQNQTALMNLNNAKLEDVRALQQGTRDITAQVRDILTDDPSTEATLKKLLVSQSELTDAMLKLFEKAVPPFANRAGGSLIPAGTTENFSNVRSIRIEALGADVELKLNGRPATLPKDRSAEWIFDTELDGSISVTTLGGAAFVSFTF